jgi:O-antigen ligase
MAFFRSEQGIGRGEVRESRIEVPFFLFFMLFCGLCLLVLHTWLQNLSITVAAAVSMFVFGATAVRADFGVYILIVAMLLSPEIDAGRELSGTRNLNLRYDDILIVVIFLGVMVKLGFEGRLRLWQPSPVNAGIVAYYSVCVVSTLLAWERGLPAWDKRSAFFIMLKMLEFYMLFWLAGHAIRNLRDMRHMLTLFFIVAIIVSVYAGYTVGHEVRVGAPFEKGGTEPNTLGGYLVIIMCVAMGLLTQRPGLLRKLPFLLLILLTFYPFLYTLSRASYLAIIVGFCVLSVISRKYWILITIIAVLGSSTLIMPEVVQERVAYTIQEESGEEIMVAGRETGVKVDKSTHERFLVWRKVRFILTLGGIYPFIGGGVSWESVLDSQYARVILETGLLGLAAFLFLQFCILKNTRQAWRWTDDWIGRGVSMGTFAATLALTAHSSGTISFLIVRIMEPYWLLVAMTVVVRNDAWHKHWERHQARKAAEAARLKRAGEAGGEPRRPAEAFPA